MFHSSNNNNLVGLNLNVTVFMMSVTHDGKESITLILIKPLIKDWGHGNLIACHFVSRIFY